MPMHSKGVRSDMDDKTVSHISKQVARQFPEVAGAAPSIKAQGTAKGVGHSATYLLTFKGRVTAQAKTALDAEPLTRFLPNGWAPAICGWLLGLVGGLVLAGWWF